MNLACAYGDLVGLGHRRRLAQFFTPPPIARFMVDWVLSGRHGRANKVHDPAFGLGAFFENAPEECEFTGGDADDAILAFFSEHSRRMPSRLSKTDYLLDFGSRYDNIVCNPPYLRFQKFLNRDAVAAAFAERLGVRLSGYTNIASAFLVKSISELKRGGRLAYIMPSEFLNAGYGAMVKEWLIRDGHLDSVIEVECEKEAFDEVTTSVCIVLFDSSRRLDAVSFRKVAAVGDFPTVMERPPVNAVPAGRLSPREKWERFFVPPGESVKPALGRLQRLSEYGRFSRGIATGANAFFVLSRSDIASKGLSDGDCVPCITKSQQLKKAVFTDEDFCRLSDEGAGVHLFSPGDAPDAAALEYIHEGEKIGYDKGFITRHRRPWYRTERRKVSPLLFNVFSRGGYKVVRNYSSALTLTNFHCFYPNPLREGYVDVLFLYLLSRTGRRILSLSKRRYGNSLDKFEPNDLNMALVPRREFFDSLDQGRLRRAMEAVRHGEDVAGWLEARFQSLLLPEGAKQDDWSAGADNSAGKPVQLCFAL